MIGIRARHFALLAFLLSACAGGGDPSANSSRQGGFGSSQSALLPVTVDPCGDSNDLHYGTCARETYPNEPVWPSLFQVIGLNQSDGTGVQQVNELAFKIKPYRTGRPGSFTMYARRLSSLTDAAGHDLVVDILTLNPDGTVPIPLVGGNGCGSGFLPNQVARARYNLALLPFSSTSPVDQKLSMNFTAGQTTRLDFNTVYGVYVHLESPAKDRLGVAGMEKDAYGPSLGLQPYTRQARVLGAACLTNPLWAAVANRDVFFTLNVDDGCIAGAGAPACGVGICYTNRSPMCDSYGNFLDCTASYCDTEDDDRCIPQAGLTGVPEDKNAYGCDVAKKSCYRRIPVHKHCTSDVDCRPQVPQDESINVGDYTCDLPTQTCNPPTVGAVECLAANDPICVPTGAADPSKYGCDTLTKRCYTLFGSIQETCNGLDDDCDGQTDEGLNTYITCGTGACVRQEYSCGPDGRPFQCPNPDTYKPLDPVTHLPRKASDITEICNNVDDNCDGAVDNGIALQECGTGECHVTNVQACNADHSGVFDCEAYSDTFSTTEFCDGLDQDCNGYIDDGVDKNGNWIPKMTKPYYPYASTTKGKGICTEGEQTCHGANGIPAWDVTKDPVGPAPEECNGLDDDCDGFKDNLYPGDPTTRLQRTYYDEATYPGTLNVGVCHAGHYTCGGLDTASGVVHPDGEWWPDTTGAAQPVYPAVGDQCDGLDNDCDGVTDEGGAEGGPLFGQLTCGIGVCQVVISECDPSYNDPVTGEHILPANCGPKALGNIGVSNPLYMASGENYKACNGLDDDCDGYVDNFPSTKVNSNLSRDCWTGANGICTTNATTGAITCNGICKPGTESCTVPYWRTEGKAGVAAPDPTACGGQVTPLTEVCNGLDDDCDGQTDEGSLCGAPAANAQSMTCATRKLVTNGPDITQCYVNQCLPNWYDVDGDPSNGCEVRDDANALANPSNTSANNSCLPGLDMGILPVAPATAGSITSLVSQSGIIPMNTMADYFVFTVATPANLTEAGQKIQVKLRDTAGGGTSNFKMYISSSSCTNNLNYCNASSANLDTWDFWDANCVDPVHPEYHPCSTAPIATPSTVGIKVVRTTGATLSSAGYTLSVTRQTPPFSP